MPKMRTVVDALIIEAIEEVDSLFDSMILDRRHKHHRLRRALAVTFPDHETVRGPKMSITVTVLDSQNLQFAYPWLDAAGNAVPAPSPLPAGVGADQYSSSDATIIAVDPATGLGTTTGTLGTATVSVTDGVNSDSATVTVSASGVAVSRAITATAVAKP